MEWIDILYVIAGVVGLILGWLGIDLRTLVRERIQSEGIKRALDWAAKAGVAAVKEVMQTYSQAIKEASKDGTLTPEEKAEARKQALQALKRNLGAQGMRELEKSLGLPSGEIDLWLGGQIEAAVFTLKGTVARGGDRHDK